MNKLEKLLSKYDYHLPKELIAQQPASPRDSARMLVFRKKTGQVFFDVFSSLPSYLPKNAVLVFNQTKVIPARLLVTKPTGGKARLLYLGHNNKEITALSDRKLTMGDKLTIANGKHFFVMGKDGSAYILKPSFPAARIEGVLKACGITPLPPYIKKSPLTEKELRKKYQAVFAKKGQSVAAPTASLHFTSRLLKALTKNKINSRFVSLDVGLGTFAPLKEENVATGKLHLERYRVTKKTADFLNKAKSQGRPIIAVGTTVARTLESAAKNQKLSLLSGKTNLFIKEGYKYRFVDGLITNFHVPKSSLMMLVAAMIGRKRLLSLYGSAIEKKFRFFSFGDGMLII